MSFPLSSPAEASHPFTYDDWCGFLSRATGTTFFPRPLAYDRIDATTWLPHPAAWPYQIYVLDPCDAKSRNRIHLHAAHSPDLFELAEGTYLDLSDCIAMHRAWLVGLEPVVDCPGPVRVWEPRFRRFFFVVDEVSIKRYVLTRRRICGMLVELREGETVVRPVDVSSRALGVECNPMRTIPVTHYERYTGLKMNDAVKNLEIVMGGDEERAAAQREDGWKAHWILR